MTKPLTVDEENLARCMRSPIAFSHGLLGHTTWHKQDEMLESIFKYTKTAVKACHASSKTFAASEAALYWLARHDDGIVISTAPGDRQVEGLLWKEIRDVLSSGQCRIAFGVRPLRKSIKINEKNYGLGMATRSDSSAGRGVRFQGFHGGKILLIVDEAPGVSQDIWDGIQGIQAGGEVHVVALGNPVIPSGPFYDIFHTKSEGWHNITIDAFETPNLEGVSMQDIADMSPEELAETPSDVPNLISRRWVRDMMDELDVDPDAADELQDPLWQSKVRGQFPTQGVDSLIWLAWIDKVQAQRPEGEDSFFTAGVDPAGPGDNETSVCIVEHHHITGMRSWRKADPRGEVIAYLNGFGARLKEVRVDVDGIGYYFARHLEDEGFNVIDFRNGEKSEVLDKAGKPRFENKKAESYWNLRSLFRSGLVTGKITPKHRSQLSSIRHGNHPKTGAVRIESKEAMAKRGVKSPDEADSHMMAEAPMRISAMPPTHRMTAMHQAVTYAGFGE